MSLFISVTLKTLGSLFIPIFLLFLHATFFTFLPLAVYVEEGVFTIAFWVGLKGHKTHFFTHFITLLDIYFVTFFAHLMEQFLEHLFLYVQYLEEE